MRADRPWGYKVDAICFSFMNLPLSALLLVLLTVFAGAVTAWLADTATALHAPSAYIAANQLPEGN